MYTPVSGPPIEKKSFCRYLISISEREKKIVNDSSQLYNWIRYYGENTQWFSLCCPLAALRQVWTDSYQSNCSLLLTSRTVLAMQIQRQTTLILYSLSSDGMCPLCIPLAVWRSR